VAGRNPIAAASGQPVSRQLSAIIKWGERLSYGSCLRICWGKGRLRSWEGLFFRGGVTMPIFEYRCKKCEVEFETLVLGRETPECPTCHGSRLERLMSTFAAVTGRSPTEAGPGRACGSCGDPRGPGACSMN